MHLRITIAIAALALFAASTPAHAQDNPENGDTGQWQQPNNGQNNGGWNNGGNGNNGNPPQGNGQWNNGQGGNGQNNGQWNNGQGNNGQGNGQGNGQWGQDNEHAGAPHGAGEHAATPVEPGTNDWSNEDNHSAAVHHLGVGFFGIVGVPIGGAPPSATGGTVSAPTIGIRYWLNDLVGLEAAIGIGFTSLNASSGSLSIGQGSAFAMAFHVGLPLAIAHWKHFSFIAEPEIQVGFSTGSLPNSSDPIGLFDDSYSGFVFRIGGRIGGEVHFGFIGVPQLSLQATVGLHLSYASTNQDICAHDPATGGTGCPVDNSATQSTLNISTGVFNNPWDIFVAGISAIYYL